MDLLLSDILEYFNLTSSILAKLEWGGVRTYQRLPSAVVPAVLHRHIIQPSGSGRALCFLHTAAEALSFSAEACKNPPHRQTRVMTEVSIG